VKAYAEQTQVLNKIAAHLFDALFFGDVFDDGTVGDAGVVDQDIDAIVVRFDFGDEVEARGGVGYIQSAQQDAVVGLDARGGKARQ